MSPKGWTEAWSLSQGLGTQQAFNYRANKRMVANCVTLTYPGLDFPHL